jgi:hypothetical protein
VPDIKTLKKDWKRAGVEFANDAGLRLDYHALRHTFSSALDRAGASRTTKKRLMRHLSGDVTDGYSHAELAEMAAVLNRIPSPQAVTSPCPVDQKKRISSHRGNDFYVPVSPLGYPAVVSATLAA